MYHLKCEHVDTTQRDDIRRSVHPTKIFLLGIYFLIYLKSYLKYFKSYLKYAVFLNTVVFSLLRTLNINKKKCLHFKT